MASTTTYSADIIDICPSCGTSLYGPGNFCTACGAGISPAHTEPQPVGGGSPHHIAARGFGQAFGLHPAAAVTTLAVNAMIFGGDIVTAGAIVPLAVIVAFILGFITWRSQIRWYGDDSESALIKAAIVGLLTAIPVGLPSFLTVPSGIVGAFHILRRKS